MKSKAMELYTGSTQW